MNIHDKSNRFCTCFGGECNLFRTSHCISIWSQFILCYPIVPRYYHLTTQHFMAREVLRCHLGFACGRFVPLQGWVVWNAHPVSGQLMGRQAHWVSIIFHHPFGGSRWCCGLGSHPLNVGRMCNVIVFYMHAQAIILICSHNLYAHRAFRGRVNIFKTRQFFPIDVIWGYHHSLVKLRHFRNSWYNSLRTVSSILQFGVFSGWLLVELSGYTYIYIYTYDYTYNSQGPLFFRHTCATAPTLPLNVPLFFPIFVPWTCIQGHCHDYSVSHRMMHVPRHVNHKADLCRGVLGPSGAPAGNASNALGNPKWSITFEEPTTIEPHWKAFPIAFGAFCLAFLAWAVFRQLKFPTLSIQVSV